MNTYLWIHRVKGPAMLLVFGITALLNEWDVISYGKSWPLYLIVFGVLQLAERAAWSQYAQQYPPGTYPGQYPPGTGTVGGTVGGVPPSGPTSTSLTVTPADPASLRPYDSQEGR
jgi:hypothetical protein